MEDLKIIYMKEALLQCARENRDIPAPTFRINISRLCEDAELRIRELEEENEQLKKNAVVWHKVTCFDEPDENGYTVAGNPAEEGKDYLVLLKNKRILISTLGYDDDGYFFEDYDWEDIEAWAELPEVKE